MACSSSPKMWSASAYTNGSDASPAFVPLSARMALADLGSLATQLEVVDLTTNFTVRPAYRLSQDGISWGTARGVGGYQSAAGRSYADFAEISLKNARFIEFGVQALNATGTSDIARGSVKLEIGLRKPTPRVFEKVEVDLENDHEGTIASGFTGSVSLQASGYYRVQLTGKGAIADGISEMFVRTFAIRGNDGTIVDLSEGKHGVVWEILVDASNFPDDERFLFHFGPCQVTGTSLAAPTGVNEATFVGFTSGTGTGARGNSKTDSVSNSTTTNNSVRRLRAHWIPHIDDVNGKGFGWTVAQWLDSSDEHQIVYYDFNSNAPNTSKPWGMGLALGFDEAHTNTQYADIRVFMRAFRLPNP